MSGADARRAIALAPPPSWLPVLVGFEVERAAAWSSDRSVWIRAASAGGERALLELRGIDGPGEPTCARVVKGPGGRRARAPIPAFSRMSGEQRRSVAIFAARVLWLDAPPDNREFHAPSPRERRARDLVEALEAAPRGDEHRDDPWTTAHAEDPALADVGEYLDVLAGRWGAVFARDAAGGSAPWVAPIVRAIGGDAEALSALASRAPIVDGPLANVVAMAFEHLGFSDAALGYYHRGADAVFGRRRADVCIELAKLHRARGESDEAVTWIRRALLGDTPSDDVLRRACDELVRCGAFDDARAVLEERCARAPFDRAMALSLAELLCWAGRSAEAWPWLERASDRERDARSLTCRGALLALNGRFAEAMDALSRADALRPGDLEINAWLAELHLRRGELEPARARLATSRLRAQGAVHIVLAAAVHEAEDLPPDAEIFTLAGLLGARAEAFRGGSDERREAALSLLERFGGQRGEPPTRLVEPSAPDGLGLEILRLPPADPILSSRVASGDTLKLVGTLPIAELERRFDELAARFDASPHPHCYRGELMLWLGRYDEALASFDAALARARARWAYVGKAAVHVLRGEHERADAELAECDRHFAPIVGATTHVYVGEGCRRRADYAGAIEHLQIAVHAKPGRAGAWMNLALSHLALGDREEATRIFDMLATRLPRLLWDAWRAKSGRAEWPVPRKDIEGLFEQALEMMRGNRSSHRITYFDADGVFRVVPADGRWRERLAKHAPFVAMELRRRLALGLSADSAERG